MKFRTFLITSSLLLSGLAWAGPNDADHKPMHGGVLTTSSPKQKAPRVAGPKAASRPAEQV